MEARVYPVKSKLLPEKEWPLGYRGTVLSELLEEFGYNMKEINRLTGIPRQHLWRQKYKMKHENYDWRATRAALEKRSRKSKRKKGRPPKDTVFAGGEELKLAEEDEKPDDYTYALVEEMEEGEGEDDAERKATKGDGNGKKPAAEKYDPGKGIVSGVGLQTRRPVVTFRVAHNEIVIDPDSLFEMYFIFTDIKRRTDCAEDFMATLRLGLEMLWHVATSEEEVPAVDMSGVPFEYQEQEAEVVTGG